MTEKFYEDAIIIRQEEIATNIYSMWLHTEQIARLAKPGQFVTLYCRDGSRLLPRPISICEVDRGDCSIRLVYHRRTASGDGTFRERLSEEEQESVIARRRYRHSAPVTAREGAEL